MNQHVTELTVEPGWDGSGINEVGYAIIPGALREAPIVRIDPYYFRPTEVETLLGDASKVKIKLEWVHEISAQQMCAYDLAEAKKNAMLKHHGYNVNVSIE